MASKWIVAASLLLSIASTITAFNAPTLQHNSRPRNTALSAHKNEPSPSFESRSFETPSNESNRRTFLTTIAGSTSSAIIFSGSTLPASAEDEEAKSDAFESIAARAARVSVEVSESERAQAIADEATAQRRKELAQTIKEDKRTIYDFTLPVNGKSREVAELVGQTFGDGDGGDGWTDGGEEDVNASEGVLGTRVKAILVVNIKQDDPIARKNIPELIALSSKFGKNGEFAVIISPTDQGYYEPDTSALLRLKVEQEYGYGNTKGTILTDKVNLLGTGALPFWRWLEGTCRTPAGLGKIQANFEKFLVDGRTGKPLRRYPRKYQPYDIADDIAALINGRPLPPAQNNFKEEWRNAAKESENDTYRFQKGLNYFDQ